MFDVYSEVDKLLNRVLEIQGRLLKPDDPDFANTYILMVAPYCEKGLLQEALASATRAMELRARGLGESHEKYGDALAQVGVIQRHLGYLDAATESGTRAIEIREAVLGPDHPHLAFNLSNLAVTIAKRAQLDEAAELQSRALKIYRERIGEQTVATVSGLCVYGSVLNLQGHLNGSLNCFERAIKTAEGIFGPEHMCLAPIVSNLAVVYSNLNKKKEAEACIERAKLLLQLRAANAGESDVDSLFAIAGKYMLSENYAQCRALLQKCLEMNRPQEALDAENIAMKMEDPEAEDYELRAKIYEKLSRGDLAIADATKAVQMAPLDMNARVTRYTIATQRGNLPLIVEDAQALLKQHPGKAAYLLFDAEVSVLVGDAARALAECAAMPQDLSQDQRTEMRLIQEQAYEQRGDFQKAFTIIDAAPFTAKYQDRADRCRASIYLGSNQVFKARAIVDRLWKRKVTESTDSLLKTQIAWFDRDFNQAFQSSKDAFNTSDPEAPAARAYPAVLNFLASQRCGIVQGDKLLRQADAALTSSDWLGKVTAYMCGRMTADQLVEAAAGIGQLTEAHCYVGLRLSQQGKTAAAKPHLEWVVHNGIKTYIEYHLAQAELQLNVGP